ncbi:MAG TPA: NADH-ubiquinone oxidoreductase-F iron-sulfur binding region domain-containing protein [Aggregatilineales bacterium]|nr:NADH-ubiquinone oxidoreductase-F iron-sulfur binding region domain-containing protein [Aggregatilineales bacterium]
MLAEDLHRMAAHERAQQLQYDHHIIVCSGTACRSANSEAVRQALEQQVQERSQIGVCTVTNGGCRGLCAAGPMVSVEPAGLLYQGVTPADAGAIVDSLGSAPVPHIHCDTSAAFFSKQRALVLEFAGNLDPDRIESYIANGGYDTLLKAVTEMTPTQIRDEIVRSGLRGRGGAGYSTGLKWNTVAKAQSAEKYVICNGDEGDPGAFMNRSEMEDYPFRILEGMTIAAYAVGAQQGYIYVRAEYPLAVSRLKGAIRQSEKLGLLGNGIFGTSFNFNVDIRLGAGAFVCGEETALIASVEGKRGNPRPRPPYPAEHGLWGHPTLINNVETFANIVPIIRNGSEWFAGIGTAKSKGTKVFALSGRIKNTGLVEIPMGMTLREIIYDIGGGIPGGRHFKAVQTGGPSGGCITAQHLDLPMDYEALMQVGTFMGSGGMIVMDDSSCMVDVARYFMEFCMTESCGKCIPCRVGTAQMFDLLDKITRGEATLDDLALLEELADMVRNTSLCGLGQGAPNPVRSTLRYFRDEYLSHIVDKVCPAGVCKMQHREEVLP